MQPLKMCVSKHLCDIWQGMVILLNTCCAWQEHRASMPAHLVLPTPSDVSLSGWEGLRHEVHIGEKHCPQLKLCPTPTQCQDMNRRYTFLWGWNPENVEDVQCPSGCWGATTLMCLLAEGSVVQRDATCQIKPSSTLWPLPSMTYFRTSPLMPWGPKSHPETGKALGAHVLSFALGTLHLPASSSSRSQVTHHLLRKDSLITMFFLIFSFSHL